MSSRRDVQQLVTTFCPVYRLSRRERYPPCSLAEAIASVAGDATSTRPTSISTAPVYYLWDERERQITYVTFFTRDGGKCGCGLGGHRPDVEFARFYLRGTDTPSPTIASAYYSRHSCDRGTWLDGGVPLDPRSGRPLIYVARGSHGNLPRAGVFPAVWCFGNDFADEDGTTWDPLARTGDGGEQGSKAPVLLNWLDVLKHFGDDYTQFVARTLQLPGAPSGVWANLAYQLTYPIGKWLGLRAGLAAHGTS